MRMLDGIGNRTARLDDEKLKVGICVGRFLESFDERRTNKLEFLYDLRSRES
jgi:hypothetical protein